MHAASPEKGSTERCTPSHCHIKQFSQADMDKLSSRNQELEGNCLLPSLPAVLPAVCFICYYERATKQFRFVSFQSTGRVLSNLWLHPSYSRTVLAQGLLDTMNSWQWDKVKALPDHAGTDQPGLFMSLGMGHVGYSCLGADLGDRCLPFMSSACQRWPFGDLWLCFAGCALLFQSAVSQHWCVPSWV